MQSERDLIAKLAGIFGNSPGQVIRSIGDDCAVLRVEEGYDLLWTIDSLIEGVHFDLLYTSLRLLGKKALAVNVSDIAAMGGEPQYALLSLGWPPERNLEDALELAEGMQESAREYGVALIGGDTVGAPKGLTLSLTVLGRVRPNEMLGRDGAQIGDLVYVSGPLGQSAAGLEILRHGLVLPEETKKPLLQAFLDPQPQVSAGRVLARNHLATSLIDLSDGLASDLYQICLQSRVGALVEAQHVPISPGVREVAIKTGKDPLDLALKGGEDYFLLFTGSPAQRQEMARCFARAKLSEPYCVGKIVSGSGIRLRTPTGNVEISGGGFDHFSKA